MYSLEWQQAYIAIAIEGSWESDSRCFAMAKSIKWRRKALIMTVAPSIIIGQKLTVYMDVKMLRTSGSERLVGVDGVRATMICRATDFTPFKAENHQLSAKRDMSGKKRNWRLIQRSKRSMSSIMAAAHRTWEASKSSIVTDRHRISTQLTVKERAQSISAWMMSWSEWSWELLMKVPGIRGNTDSS